MPDNVPGLPNRPALSLTGRYVPSQPPRQQRLRSSWAGWDGGRRRRPEPEARLLAGGGPRELRGPSLSDAKPPDGLRDPTDASHQSHVVTNVFDNRYRAESRAPITSRSIGAVPSIERRVPSGALEAANHRVLSGPRLGSEGAYCEAPATVPLQSLSRKKKPVTDAAERLTF